jgi:hypothetical protein
VAPIEKAVGAFLAELTSSRGVNALERDSLSGAANREVVGLLWEPLAEVVQDANQIFVSPDGFLGTLPFEILHLDDGSFLLEHHGLVYLESIP